MTRFKHNFWTKKLIKPYELITLTKLNFRFKYFETVFEITKNTFIHVLYNKNFVMYVFYYYFKGLNFL